MNQIKLFICFTLLQLLIGFGTTACVSGQTGLPTARKIFKSPAKITDSRVQARIALTRKSRFRPFQDDSKTQSPTSDESNSQLELQLNQPGNKDVADEESDDRTSEGKDPVDEDPVDEESDDEETDDDSEKTPKRPEFGTWPRKSIQGISVDIRETSQQAPEDRSGQLMNVPGVPWSQFNPTQKVFAWAAPNIRYQPLYFEDVALERYGQTPGIYRQPIASGIQFFKSYALLSHQIHHDAPRSCDYPLGFCRPGNSAPYTIQRSYFGLKPQESNTASRRNWIFNR